MPESWGRRDLRPWIPIGGKYVWIAGIVDNVGEIPNSAGLSVISFTAGEAPADGVLQIKLADGKVIDIAANEHA